MKTKVVIFGCKTTTKFLIENLSEKIKIDYLITVDEKLGNRFNVADYCDLSETAQLNNIEIYRAKQYNLKSREDLDFISSLNIDLAFVVGWQRLIPETILQSLSIGAFGMHGSSMDLPLGRGRSPMNWSLIEGKKFFYTNLFKYNSGVDSGDILDTFKFTITSEDTAETMHFKNTLSMKYLIFKNIDRMFNNSFTLKKQKDVTPTYYPKRNPTDSLIDWSSDIFKIERFIRAVTKPFNGSYSFICDTKVIIYSSQIFETVDFGYSGELNGKIVEVFSNGKFLVNCSGGLLLINDYLCDVKVNKGDILYNRDEELHHFQTNTHGYYDLEEEE